MQAIWKDIPEQNERLAKLGFESIQELQTLQDKFSRTAKLFSFCMNSKGEKITDISGKEYGAEKLYEQIDKSRFDSVFRELSGSLTEDQIVMSAGIPGVKIAAQIVRVEGKLAGVWVVYAVIEEEAVSIPEGVSCVVTEDELYTALDFLRTVSYKFAYLGYRYQSAQAEKLRNHFSEQEVEASLRRTKAVMEIVQMLESDAELEVVLQNILQIAGNSMDIGSAQVFQVHDETMDIMTEWLSERMVSSFDQTRNLEVLPFLKGEVLRSISIDTQLPEEELEALDRLNIKSTIIVPIEMGDEAEIYICFNECTKPRIWDVQDIKFIGNVTKIMQSILIRRVQKSSLVGSHAALESILDHAGSAIYVCDKATGERLFANRVLKKIFKTEMENGLLDELLSAALEKGRQGSGSYEVYQESKGHWYDMHSTMIRWVDGRIGVLYAMYDISDKKVYQKRIEQQAYTDFLTGLYNRMRCERDLAFQIDEAAKSRQRGALLYLDLDDFKHINEGLGHQYGDVLLKAISHTLQRIEGIDNNCYRVGGDEFIIIIPSAYYAKFNSIIEEIKDIFSKPWFLGDGDYYCTMSMGIVTFPDSGNSVQDLIKKADIAMYEAKKGGKNRVAYYTDGVQSSSNKRLDMEKNMRDATVDGYDEFEVYYQPIIDVNHEHGRDVCCGAEALIRWNSSEMGFISPADFIPLAEYLGLINPIGNHVLREACRECKKWNDSGYPNYKVNVNLSVVQLLQPDIVENIERALQETGINPVNLTLEVTESLAINDMERMKEILRRIRALGTRIALDDFGTGYSSLNHIRELPFDVIKIDQSFVKDLDKDDYSQAFVKMVTELAAAIDVNVCVEGIETKAQYEVVRKMPISMIQGYYFDKPMNADSFEGKYAIPRK